MLSVPGVQWVNPIPTLASIETIQADRVSVPTMTRWQVPCKQQIYCSKLSIFRLLHSLTISNSPHPVRSHTLNQNDNSFAAKHCEVSASQNCFTTSLTKSSSFCPQTQWPPMTSFRPIRWRLSHNLGHTVPTRGLSKWRPWLVNKQPTDLA